MWETAEVYRFLAVGQVALLGAVLLHEHRRDPSALASGFLILTVIAHLLAPTAYSHGFPSPVVHGLVFLGLVVPFAFWLLAEVHFDDEFALRPVHALLLGTLLAVGYLSWVTRHSAGPATTESQRAFWSIAPRLIGIALVGHALLKVSAGARSDLVVPRLKRRYACLVLSGTYIFLELLAEALLGSFGARTLAELVHAVTVFALVFGLSFIALSFRPEVLRPSPPSVEGPLLDPALGERLRELITVEQVFREEGLTIAALAERLGAHEYKVRQLINTQLGFRNFNAFLHQLRVDEAVKTLVDPSKSHLGVAQVAFEVGYRSLGPFNKAFKEITGRTPTEFRTARRGQGTAAAAS